MRANYGVGVAVKCACEWHAQSLLELQDIFFAVSLAQRARQRRRFVRGLKRAILRRGDAALASRGNAGSPAPCKNLRPSPAARRTQEVDAVVAHRARGLGGVGSVCRADGLCSDQSY